MSDGFLRQRWGLCLILILILSRLVLMVRCRTHALLVLGLLDMARMLICRIVIRATVLRVGPRSGFVY